MYQKLGQISVPLMKPLQKKQVTCDQPTRCTGSCLTDNQWKLVQRLGKLKALRNHWWYTRAILLFLFAHLLALFTSIVESSPANACCNSPFEKGWLNLSPSLVLCTSGSPLNISGPLALTSSFDTSLRLLLSEGVDGLSGFAAVVGPLSDVHMPTPGLLQPAVLAEAGLTPESDWGLLLAWCCCCFCTDLLAFSNMDVSWSSSSLHIKQESHQQMAHSKSISNCNSLHLHTWLWEAEFTTKKTPVHCKCKPPPESSTTVWLLREKFTKEKCTSALQMQVSTSM